MEVMESKMDNFLELGTARAEAEMENIAIYRGHVSVYKTARGYARKTELTKMKRLSTGFDMLEEGFMAMGSDMELDLSHIVDGRLYIVKATSSIPDYETGEVDYELYLKSYKQENSDD